MSRLLRGLGPRGVLYVTWDEGSRRDRRGLGGRGGGRIALIAAGGAARKRTRVAVPANHYGLLPTLEAGYDLRALRNAGQAPVLHALLESAGRPRGEPTR